MIESIFLTHRPVSWGLDCSTGVLFQDSSEKAINHIKSTTSEIINKQRNQKIRLKYLCPKQQQEAQTYTQYWQNILHFP